MKSKSMSKALGMGVSMALFVASSGQAAIALNNGAVEPLAKAAMVANAAAVAANQGNLYQAAGGNVAAFDGAAKPAGLVSSQATAPLAQLAKAGSANKGTQVALDGPSLPKPGIGDSVKGPLAHKAEYYEIDESGPGLVGMVNGAVMGFGLIETEAQNLGFALGDGGDTGSFGAVLMSVIALPLAIVAVVAGGLIGLFTGTDRQYLTMKL